MRNAAKIFAFIGMLASVSFAFSITIAFAEVKPYIAVDFAPAIEQGSEVRGHIWFEEEAGRYYDYRVTMALEVTKGGYIWGPKPTYDNPSVAVNENGTFVCQFVTGGDDKYAETLYVYLIPAGFLPDGNNSRTEQNAVDKVTIYRDSEGNVEIHQTTEPPSQLAKQKYPAETLKLSLNYSPYTNGLSPEINSPVPLELVEWQLGLIHPYADTIRLFGVTGELAKIYKTAKETYGFRVIAGCWFDARSSESEIFKELDALIKLADDGYIDMAIVGSELLYRGDCSVSSLISYINYVRNGIQNKAVLVATSDTVLAWIDNPSLVNACDVVLVTIYPFFNGVPADKSAAALQDAYNSVKWAVGNSKEVVISETGWPTAGSPEGAAVPSMENAERYFKDVYGWSRAEDVEVIFFSALDELWKREGVNDDIGVHWGHFEGNGTLKSAYADIYSQIPKSSNTATLKVRFQGRSDGPANVEKLTVKWIKDGVTSSDVTVNTDETGAAPITLP